MIRMKNLRALLLLSLAVIVFSWTGLQAASPAAGHSSESEVVAISEIEWSPLNPARGDASPRAADLWGDRTEPGPTGFLVQFVDGFSSPPHIHNVTYRGMVIDGLIHNDDPGAENMWLPKGSFWTQPAGEVHITSADANSNMAYIEIEDGPYLVLPSEEAFDNGERPVNVDKSNLVWLDASNIDWIDQPGATASVDGPKVAFLWGDPQEEELNGTLIKLPTGFTGKIYNKGATFRAVLIQGRSNYSLPGKTDVKSLEPGSYFGSNGQAIHQVSCESSEECVIYVREEGKFDILPA
ncbi:MAG: DUF4437 domain-containing protein [Cyanobacteria bacterium P01_D01_bin.56]